MSNYPIFRGTHTSGTTDAAPITPFTGVTIDDPYSAQNPTETVTIQLLKQDGVPSGGTLADGPGFTGPATLTMTEPATYQLTGTIDDVTAELDALVFTPYPGQAGATVFTETQMVVSNSFGRSNAYYPDGATLISNTTDPDTVSLSPDVSYSHGVFTLSGTASSAVGISNVEISATLPDGAVRDLGAATENSDWTFTFADRVGRQQSFFQATLTDGTGGPAVSADPGFNLSGRLGPDGHSGEQDSFDATDAVTSAVFRPDGSRLLRVLEPDQTVDLRPFDDVRNRGQGDTTFVFNPGNVFDVVHGFRLGGAEHDAVQLPSSDFGTFADVLRNTSDLYGSAYITDPNTGDGLYLQGITKAELRAHPKDVGFG